jgi:hypothetical protein
VFCPGCRADWNAGRQDWYAGWWADNGDLATTERWMREHQNRKGTEHQMRITEEPEGVPLPAHPSTEETSP